MKPTHDELLIAELKKRAEAGSRSAALALRLRVMENMGLIPVPEQCHHCAFFTEPCTCGARPK